MRPEPDLLADLELELRHARRAATAAVDWAEAAAELHAHALVCIAQLRLRRPLRPSDMWDDEESRARVEALRARVARAVEALRARVAA